MNTETLANKRSSAECEVSKKTAVRLTDLQFKEEYRNAIRALTGLERDNLKDSIARFGVKVPIDINEKMEVVDGHHRTDIAIGLRHEWIPAIIHNFEQEGITEHQFIYEVNVFRRHLNDFQRGELYYKLEQRNAEIEDKVRHISGLKQGDKFPLVSTVFIENNIATGLFQIKVKNSNLLDPEPAGTGEVEVQYWCDGCGTWHIDCSCDTEDKK